ncbi:MAG: pyridoxamine 5'-phosphate oxidase family protein [Thermodesulfobacteriota bacterium]|nr:pyridoxamine 5'-phosphate oxidase family protein [Thermodesulfobacteriota bacterium]
MRRSEKEITDQSTIEAIIHASLVCRLALSDGNQPYIVPLCFGYRNQTLYFHSAREGKKIDLLKKNNRTCFEFDVNSEIIEADKPCKWGMKYQSVIGFGKAIFVENVEEKQKGLNIIMNHYSNRTWPFAEKAIEKIAVIKIEIEKMTGKYSS